MNWSKPSDHDDINTADREPVAEVREAWTTPSVREYVLDDVKGGLYANFEYGITLSS